MTLEFHPHAVALHETTSLCAKRVGSAIEALGLDADFVDSEWLAQHGEELAGMFDGVEEPMSVALPELPAAA